MIIVDANGRIACGTTTNGLNHKIPGYETIIISHITHSVLKI